jgi:hypothetical protein
MLYNFYKKKNLIYFVYFIFSFFFILSLFNFIFSFKNFLLINFILLINCIFFIYFIKNEEKNNYFPILPLISIFFFSTYTLSFFISRKDFFYQNFHPDILTKSIFILTLGLLSLFIGYILSGKYLSLRKIEIFYFNFINIKKKIFILFIFLILLFFIYYINDNKFLSSFTLLQQLKEPLTLFVLGLILLMIIKKDIKSIFLYGLLILLLSIIFFIEISQGSIVFIFSAIVFLCVIYYILIRKIPVISILFVILLGIFIHSIKYEIRDFIWHKDNLNSLDKIYITKNVILKNLILNKLKNNLSADINKDRLFHSINSLNIVSKLTPDKVSFFQGESYKNIYTKFIPRLIWNKKPLDEQGNFWGHRYLVLNPEDKSTSWNFPVLNEFYANFGITGVFIGMFFLGFFIKFLTLKLWTKNISDVEMLVSSIILFNFFFLENNLSQILGKIINQFFFFNMFFFALYFFFKIALKHDKSLSL